MSSSDPSQILASGWLAGIVRSRDGGATWETAFGPGFNTSAIVFDRANPSIVYAADFYPLKSTDGGESWRVINHGVESIGVGTVAIDSGDSAVLYASYNGYTLVTLYRSLDGGESWVLDPGLSAGGAIYVIYAVLPDPGRSGVAWLGTSGRGLLRGGSSEEGWRETGFTDPVSAIAVDESSDGAIYVASVFGGVFRSIDDGATWEPLGTGIPPVKIYALLVDAAGGVLYAAANDGVYSLDLRRRPRVVPPR